MENHPILVLVWIFVGIFYVIKWTCILTYFTIKIAVCLIVKLIEWIKNKFKKDVENDGTIA